MFSIALALGATLTLTSDLPRPRTLTDGPYSGRDRQLAVKIPRLDESVEIDGVLDEPVWTRAALLTGFSQYAPQDGVAADDSTQVLVWYTATAIHFGIRAYERHGAPIATLADRDRIDADDQVQLLLGTFNDGRQATVFGVNALGVQMDGTILERNSAQNGGFMARATSRDPADLSQDFVFQSKGRVTPWGYEVEVRIPFKSLRYQPGETQTWGFNVVRVVQHSGYEDSWAPARRSAASFLGQSGTLEGLTDLRRGVVLDVNPVATQRTVGARCDDPGLSTWCYSAARPELGGNVRWGVSNNLTMNATVNPDFSQIESDAGQVSFDPRQALYFAEKRPFFLENMDAFSTPNSLVYTRRIQQPRFATKLTGKVRGTSLALLTALDDRLYSAAYNPTTGLGGRTPLFVIGRVARDIGTQSRLGATYTGRSDDRWSNQVADVDGSLVFRKRYSVNFQGAASRTVNGLAGPASTLTAPLWALSLNRTGQALGLNYGIRGIDEDFIAGSGFIGRPGIVIASADQRFTFVRGRESLLQSVTFNPALFFTWKYASFTDQRDAIEKKLHLNTRYQFRGGWGIGASVLLETFGYDPELFRRVYVERRGGAVADTVAFTGTARLPNRDWVLSFGTPQWQRFSLNATWVWGQDENFYEWASSDINFVQIDALIRPTDKLRITPSLVYQDFNRLTTGELVAAARITRVKTEYQIARPLFFRVVGEYTASDRLALRDESRTGGRLLVRLPDGSYAPIVGSRTHGLRADWLVSYQPSPGTVFFAGYGSTYARFATDVDDLSDRWRPSDLLAGAQRLGDGFFVKASYLFRM